MRPCDPSGSCRAWPNNWHTASIPLCDSRQWLVSVVVVSGPGWVTLLVWAYRADVPGTLGPNQFVATALEAMFMPKSYMSLPQLAFGSLQVLEREVPGPSGRRRSSS